MKMNEDREKMKRRNRGTVLKLIATGRCSSRICLLYTSQVREHYPHDGEDKGLRERMAELLWDSGHEEQHRKHERMGVPPDTDVYLETVETAQNPEEKADGTGLARVGGLRRSIQQEILLEDV